MLFGKKNVVLVIFALEVTPEEVCGVFIDGDREDKASDSVMEVDGGEGEIKNWWMRDIKIIRFLEVVLIL